MAVDIERATARVDKWIEQDEAMRMRATPRPEPTFPPLEDVTIAPDDHVVLTCAADLKIEPVRWLWPGWLARGKFHLLAGAPGVGKTTLTMAMAACVTSGARWPDASRCDAGNVLIYSGEDDPGDTLAPRLLAAGADLSRVHFVAGRVLAGESVAFDPARDLAALAEAVEEIGGIDLLIVDPVVGAVTGDSHKNSEVRRALQPLAELAARIDCAVLGISHFSKGGQGSDPAQRVIGSVAFTALARVVLVAAKAQGKEGEQTRILARAKSNIGPDDGGIEYSLAQEEVASGVNASRVVWGAQVDGTARELLSDPDEDASAGEQDVAGFLRGLLSDGPVSVKDIFKDADGAGYSRDQVKRASIKMGVEKQKTGMGGGWVWALQSDEGSTKGAKGAPFENTLPSPPSVLPSGKSLEQEVV